MLNLYRRHLRSCGHSLRTQKKCGCPIWVQGTLHGKWLKKSLDLRNWEAAQKLVREWEGGGGAQTVPVKAACERFLTDCEARHLGPAQLGKYKLLVAELKAEFGARPVSAISVDDLRSFRESWELSAISSKKKIERLRTFFKFCQESGWTHTNPARALKPPKDTHTPTLPFSNSEIEKIVWAIEVYPERPRGRRSQVRAFVNLLRFSGLRIRDAVTLSKEKIQDGKLLLYTQKTGTPVHIPLPTSVLNELEFIPTTRFYFWSGHGNPKSAVSDWQRSLAKLFTLAGVKGHAHRFRDTFSVDLLKAGVPLESVSVLLGHSSIKTTEKHYAPWVKSRQISLEQSIEKAWKLSD